MRPKLSPHPPNPVKQNSPESPKKPEFYQLPHAIADRKGLTCTAKVVYAYLLDWQRQTGSCYPGQGKIAEACGLSSAKVANRAVGELEVAGLIEKSGGKISGPRIDRTCSYKVLAPNVVERATLPNGQRRRSRKGNVDVVERATSNVAQRAMDREIERKRERAHTARACVRASPAPCDGETQAIESIYAAYPKQARPAPARRAIAEALSIIANRNGTPDPAAWLLERVQAFAASPAGRQGRFTPGPEAWFGSGQYDDDPTTWQLGTGSERPAARDRISIKPEERNRQAGIIAAKIRRSVQSP